MRKTDISQYAGPAGFPGDNISSWKTLLRLILKGLLTVLAVLAVAGMVVLAAVASFVYSLKDSSVDFDLSKLKLNYTTFIYTNGANDDAENPVEYTALSGGEDRVWVDYDQIPKSMRDAIVAIEDKRFWEHQGVDWRRTMSAAANLFGIIKGSSGYGGSTITQQLIKNLTGESEDSITRKVKEIFRALNLEKKYSKEEILTAYLNVVNFGSGCNGVEAAAKNYFNKDIQDCDIAECAAIAGITQNPTAYNPLLHPEANKKRQQTVLGEMYGQGKISEDEYNAALAESENMQFYTDQKAVVVDETSVWNWYTDALFEDVKNGLMTAYNCSEEHAIDLIYHGGLRIYSAMDSSMQSAAETAFTDDSTFPSEYPNLQGGFYAMDYSGRVLAIVGSRGKKSSNRLFNNATDATRQPGSSIKPLAIYAPAVNLGVVNYSSLINDAPQDNWFGEGQPGPNNWDTKTNGFHGMITVEYALEQSFNAAAVTLFKTITPTYGLDFMRQKLNFTTIENGDYNLAAGIGGLTQGVTVREMTAGFQIFGNGGKYYQPYTYYYVTDHDGNVIPGMDNRNENFTQAISSSSAAVMYHLLNNVMLNGTGTRANISGWDVYGKTGTTDDNKDSWFIGGTPYAVAGVWTGYTQPEEIGDYQASFAKKIWKSILTNYLSGKPAATFALDQNVVSATYCKDTGLLANPGICTHTATGWYDKNNMPLICSGAHTASSAISSVMPESSSSEASSAASSQAASSVVSQTPSSHEAPSSSPAPSSAASQTQTSSSPSSVPSSEPPSSASSAASVVSVPASSAASAGKPGVSGSSGGSSVQTP